MQRHGLAISLALCAFASLAHAQQPRLFNPGQVPSGGALVVDDGAGGIPIVTVRRRVELSAVIGNLRNFHGRYVWLAEEPLELGNYTVILNTGTLTLESRHMIEVIEPLESRAPELVSEPSISIVTGGIREACCDAFSDMLEPGAGRCFRTHFRDEVVIDPGLSSPDSSSQLGQYFVRLTATEPEAIEPVVYRAWNEPGGLRFAVQAERYCFTLEAIEIASETVYAYEGEELCVEHGELPELEERAIDPPPDVLAVQNGCQAPPPAYQRPWCALNSPFCDGARLDEEALCFLERYVCDGAALPDTDDVFYPAPAVTPGGSSAERARARAEAASVPPVRSTSDGCSASAAEHPGSSALLVFSALALALRSRRRSRPCDSSST